VSRCEDLIHLLSDYVGGELDRPLTQEVEKHLVTCARCRVIVHTLRQTVYLCRELEPVDMPEAVQKRLHITIRQKWQQRRISAQVPASKEVDMKRKEVPHMATKKYHPLAEMTRIEDAFDRYLNRFFSDFLPLRAPSLWPAEMAWTPVVDLVDKGDHLLFKADLPGLKKEAVKISLSENNVLTVAGEVTRSEEEKKGEYYRCERCFGAFSRSIQLPVDVIQDKVEASLKEGILEIKLPKREPKKTKELEIKLK